MPTVTSADGTRIAYERSGKGSPVILLGGAFNDRSTTEPLARALSDRCTVLNCDRRGRGESGDTQPYTVEREVEDIDALIDAAGGEATLFGFSSGANLALTAAAAGIELTALALYEPPYNADASDPLLPADLSKQLADLVAEGRRGEAVELYQRVAVGMPQEVVAQLRRAPFRAGMEAIAHTLAYDAAVVGDRSLPTETLAAVRVPTLVFSGEETAPFMKAAAKAVSATLPDAELATIPGQGHGIEPTLTASRLADFLAQRA